MSASTTGGAGPTGGTGTGSTTTTPSTVPSFTPKSSARTRIDAGAIRPKIKQTDRSALSSKAYDAHQSLAVETLTTKFDLMTTTSGDNNDEKLSSTYTINMTLQQFQRKLRLYDMYRVFLLVEPDLTATDGSVLPDVIDLVGNYTDPSLKQHAVESSIVHMRTWGEDYDIENLEWSQELLENSCSDELRNLVLEQMLELPPLTHGGPLFFYLMMQIIIRTTNEATRKLIERIKKLNISKIRGENVLQATSLIRGAITRLGNKVPNDIDDIVLKIYQTTSYSHFNEIFKLMELNKRMQSTVNYTIQEITSIANSNYQEFLDTDEWQVPDSDTAYSTGNTDDSNNDKRNNRKGKGGSKIGRKIIQSTHRLTTETLTSVRGKEFSFFGAKNARLGDAIQPKTIKAKRNSKN